MQPVPTVPAVYLFSDDDGPQYVGRTGNLRARLAGHMNPSGDRYSATFAFRIALQNAAGLGLNVRGGRARVEQDVEFQNVFTLAKQQVASMQVRYLVVPDDIEQALLEVYASECLETPWNEFGNH
ncbi:MAG: hypothetical protein EXR64_04495 [Dehalococcoidia bacterium]|nr:hypothetical protein [Dehalococcoidia bacterium]